MKNEEIAKARIMSYICNREFKWENQHHISHNKHSYYNDIGYKYIRASGKKHSLRACKLVLEVARAHGIIFIHLLRGKHVPSRKIIESRVNRKSKFRLGLYILL